MLTAARSAEARLATWTEMDVAGRVWTISAARMKAKREHRVPLCGRAVEILEAVRTLGGGSDLAFPMWSGRPIGMSTMPNTPATSDPGGAARAPPIRGPLTSSAVQVRP